MRIQLLICLGLTAIISAISAEAAEKNSNKYIEYDHFILIEDKHEKARAWATCAALYDTAAIFSEKLAQKPAEAKQMRQLANGAEVAVAMTFIIEAFGTDTQKFDPARFNATWNYAKVAMKEIPATVQAVIDANFERARNSKDIFNAELERLYSGVGTCLNNVKHQQTSIELWRELATSGLLEIPDQQAN